MLLPPCIRRTSRALDRWGRRKRLSFSSGCIHGVRGSQSFLVGCCIRLEMGGGASSQRRSTFSGFEHNSQSYSGGGCSVPGCACGVLTCLPRNQHAIRMKQLPNVVILSGWCRCTACGWEWLASIANVAKLGCGASSKFQNARVASSVHAWMLSMCPVRQARSSSVRVYRMYWLQL